MSQCHLGTSTGWGVSLCHCTEGPSPTVTNFKRGDPHCPLRLSVVWGGPQDHLLQRQSLTVPSGPLWARGSLTIPFIRGGPSPSPQALCELGGGMCVPQPPLPHRQPLTITSGPSPVSSMGPRDPSPSPSSSLAPLHPAPRPLPGAEGSLSVPSGPSPAPSPQAAGSPSPCGAGPAPRGRRPRAPGPPRRRHSLRREL